MPDTSNAGALLGHGWEVAVAAWMFVVTCLSLLGTRHLTRIDKHEDRLVIIEKDLATRQDHETRLDVLEANAVRRADIQAMFDMMRSDRKEMHEENRNQLQGISERIERLNKDTTDSRHELAEKVQTLVTRVAILTDRAERVVQSNTKE